MALKFLALLGLALAAAQDVVSFKLHLPDGTTVTKEFHSIQLDTLRIHFQDQRLNGRDARVWMRRLEAKLDSAYEAYRKAYESGKLPFCESPVKERPKTTLFFHNFSVPKERGFGSHDRAGYYHRDNSGILVQDRYWDSESTTAVAIHEAVHSWCRHNAYDSEQDRWLEEGAADWVVYSVTASVPQWHVTRYFNEPCKEHLYGGGFLWWLALSSHHAAVERMELLARLHLGKRKDILFGSIHRGECDEKNSRLPYARVVRKPPVDPSVLVVPFFETAYGRIDFKSEIPSGYFLWSGPGIE